MIKRIKEMAAIGSIYVLDVKKLTNKHELGLREDLIRKTGIVMTNVPYNMQND